MNESVRIAVVGGGISGLAAAYYLKTRAARKGLAPHLRLFEETDRLGGVIRSELDTGHLLEWGPENFVSYKPKALELISELGIASEVIDSNEGIRQTYVVKGGELLPLPQGMDFLVPVRLRSFWPTRLISTRGKIRALMEPFVRPSRGEISVYDFFERRLGREFTDALVEPLVGAIYGGDVRRLSMVSALGDLHRMEQASGSLWRAMRSRGRGRSAPSRAIFLALRSGMIRLVEALAEHLQDGVGVATSTGVRNILPRSGNYLLEGDGWEETFDAVIICTPAGAAARLLEQSSPPGARALAEIPYSSSTLVYLAYPEQEFSHPLDGFGFVTPGMEPSLLGACTWVSSKFQGRCPEGSVLLRCALRGNEEGAGPSDEETIGAVHRELARLLGIDCTPTLSRIYQVRASMPQFTLGHELRRESIESLLDRHPGLFCAGAFYGGVGIPDCIKTASETVERVMIYLQSPRAKS